MGTDIHGPWLEQRHAVTVHNPTPSWWFRAKFRINRNYVLFALMAEVRKYWTGAQIPPYHVTKVLQKFGITTDEEFEMLPPERREQILQDLTDNGITQDQPSFAPRGMPKDISGDVAEEYLFWVEDASEGLKVANQCSPKRAQGWLVHEASEVWDTHPDGTLRRITRPDFHTASWLSTKEVEEVLQRLEALEVTEKPGWHSNEIQILRGIAAMMKALETPEQPCRIVFWFDN